MSGSAKDNNSADGPSRASARRRWSDEGSLLTGRSSAAQLKTQINTDYALHANLHPLVEHLIDQDAKLSVKKRISKVLAKVPYTTPTILMIFVAVFGTVLSPVVLWGLMVRIIRLAWYHDPVILYSWFFIIILCAVFLSLTLKTVELEDKRLRNFESILVETLRHRQLEILCRYGDYLSERLNTLRQYVREHGLEDKHQLSEKWTETSATLRAEEGKTVTPCHDLIRRAAEGLNWNPKVTVFMVHEYGKRNSLMHAELFDLVDTKDWNSIGQRCQEDIEKLHELFIDSDSDSKAAIENWEIIIGEFRDRWVRPSEDGSSWEAHLIIQEAIAARVDDSASLGKLSMRYKNAVSLDRDKAIKDIKKEKDHSEKQQKVSKKQADAVLQRENNLLQAEVEILRTSLEQDGVSRDLLKDLRVEVEKNGVLEKKNKTYENKIKDLEAKIKDLEKNCAKGLTRQRTIEALQKLLKDVGFEATEKKITKAKGKQTTDEKDTDIEKDTNTEEEHPTICQE